MMALTVVIGLGSAVGGLLLSYWLNAASGATIVLPATVAHGVKTLGLQEDAWETNGTGVTQF
jgi:ABC-type Mn2+/Zn2+ transport system permease subunit